MAYRKHAIAGDGEVGTALFQIMVENRGWDDIAILGKDAILQTYDKVEFLHVCFPYDEDFEQEVERYQKELNPTYTVIHSTVPVGTSSRLNATHSPIRGKHPFLREGITTLTKFVGGIGADEVADELRSFGIPVHVCRKAETTELGKLMSTLYYGVCISFTKEAERMCAEHDVPFAEAFTLFQQTYNEGYAKLDMEDVQRPVLQPMQKKIGGHCVVPNLDLISDKSRFAQFLLEYEVSRHNESGD